MRNDSSARFYELLAISVPDGTPEELSETAQAISGYVTAAGGEVLRSSNDSPWGRRRLAYPIRYHSADLRDGFYTLYHFRIAPEGIEEIEREIGLNERIIRHLLLQLDREPIFVDESEGDEAESEEAETPEASAGTPASESTANESEAAAETPEVTASEEE